MISLDSISDSMDMNLGKLQEIVKDMKAWHATVHRVTESWLWLSNQTTSKGHQSQWKDLSVAQTGIISATK